VRSLRRVRCPTPESSGLHRRANALTGWITKVSKDTKITKKTERAPSTAIPRLADRAKRGLAGRARPNTQVALVTVATCVFERVLPARSPATAGDPPASDRSAGTASHSRIGFVSLVCFAREVRAARRGRAPDQAAAVDPGSQPRTHGVASRAAPSRHRCAGRLPGTASRRPRPAVTPQTRKNKEVGSWKLSWYPRYTDFAAGVRSPKKGSMRPVPSPGPHYTVAAGRCMHGRH